MQHEHVSGFERWMKRRAAKGATTSTGDEDYRRYMASVSGAEAQKNAGRAYSLEAGGPDPAEGVPDDAVYRGYLQELDGTASRRRAEAAARQELKDREAETVRHAAEVGGGLSRSHEHLRSRLEGFGRPGEGS